MAKKKVWHVVRWAHVRNPSLDGYVTIDATLDDAVARVRSIMAANSGFVPGNSVLVVGHLRGICATKTEVPERLYASSDCTKPENVLQTIPLTVEMVGFYDLRRVQSSIASILCEPSRVWVGLIDVRSLSAVCDGGVIVIPEAAMAVMEADGKIATQADLFAAFGKHSRYRLPPLPSLRDDRLYPALQVKQIGFGEAEDEARLMTFQSQGFGHGETNTMEDVAKAMRQDETRDVIVLPSGSAEVEQQAGEPA